MDIPRLERLTVKVHLLGEPCLWSWEIVDVEDDALVESSWATEWTGYASSREALEAGAIRLTDLTRSRRGAKLDARFTPAGDQRTQPRYLVVVARAATELYASLKRTFSDSDSIEVIRDRRFRERRQRNDAVGLDRRRGDRRSRPHVEEQVRWCEWPRVPITGVPATSAARQS
jgi:hypothetical protein